MDDSDISDIFTGSYNICFVHSFILRTRGILLSLVHIFDMSL